MRLAEAALPTWVISGRPLSLTMRATNQAMFAVKIKANSLR